MFYLNQYDQEKRNLKCKCKISLPYVHEAKCSDVRRVRVGDQTHQLFAGQLECKQFIQQTESSRHNTTSSNSSHLQDNVKHITIQTK